MYKAKIYCDQFELTVLFYDDLGPRFRCIGLLGLNRMIFDQWKDGGWQAFGIIMSSIAEGIDVIGEWVLE